MKISYAKPSDIYDIMKIEHSAFIPEIQESKETFEERLYTFPQGFFILSNSFQDSTLEIKKTQIIGYFSSEIWNEIPKTNDIFLLGHSSKKAHKINGSILYFSSFALLPSFQGKHLSEPFLKECLSSICKSFPNIEKIVLLVNEEWLGARHLYKKLGFTDSRIIKDFFPSLNQNKKKSDGIIMEKNKINNDFCFL